MWTSINRLGANKRKQENKNFNRKHYWNKLNYYVDLLKLKSHFQIKLLKTCSCQEFYFFKSYKERRFGFWHTKISFWKKLRESLRSKLLCVKKPHVCSMCHNLTDSIAMICKSKMSQVSTEIFSKYLYILHEKYQTKTAFHNNRDQGDETSDEAVKMFLWMKKRNKLALAVN